MRTEPMLTLEQLAAVEIDKSIRYLEHLYKLQNYLYRDERQARILRIQNEIKEYHDDHSNKV